LELTVPRGGGGSLNAVAGRLVLALGLLTLVATVLGFESICTGSSAGRSGVCFADSTGFATFPGLELWKKDSSSEGPSLLADMNAVSVVFLPPKLKPCSKMTGLNLEEFYWTQEKIK
jgi:hypothetical protein